jgi:hypothetical protein
MELLHRFHRRHFIAIVIIKDAINVTIPIYVVVVPVIVSLWNVVVLDRSSQSELVRYRSPAFDLSSDSICSLMRAGTLAYVAGAAAGQWLRDKSERYIGILPKRRQYR